ncbi:DUF4113 domain-containing protein [Aeromonas enteropelogenes]|uniref:DUF4113 domain-containing protein n=1 Tax=Aeromonas enteropelogenes TaxID=29489 RepID=UPI003134A514
MQVIDKINQGLLDKVYFVANGCDTRKRMMKWEQLSPLYTTAVRQTIGGEVSYSIPILASAPMPLGGHLVV